MSATTATNTRSRHGVRSRVNTTNSAAKTRAMNRATNLTIQGSWVFVIVFFVTYAVASIAGHVLGESQRASAKVFSPQLRKARETELALKSESAVDGSLQDVVGWAKARGWSFSHTKQVSGTYVASR